MKHEFYTQLARMTNSGSSRSIVVHGNIYDLFWDGADHVPLIPFLVNKTKPAGRIQILYELNGPIRIAQGDIEELREAWIVWKSGKTSNDLILKNLRRSLRGEVAGGQDATVLRKRFDKQRLYAHGNATSALEFMRQLCLCSRECMPDRHLLFFIEGADMLLPAGNGDISSLNDSQLARIAIMQDWFTDQTFVRGTDTVCLVAESASMIHPRVARMPQVRTVEVPSPNKEQRQNFIDKGDIHLRADYPTLAAETAGLSLYAVRQLLLDAAYDNGVLAPDDVVVKVEEFIQSQVGEDTVEFKKPHHTLKDVIGNTKLKQFIRSELIPRFQATDDSALPGAAVGGPIGGGKTFIFEAMAAELGMPVLVLKNLRSQWFGQTDVIFERLRRALDALDKVVIFVDEADTQFGRVDATAHATEKRLTGKIQQMMSDSRLRGKVIWLLMTARIHLLSPDIRRPGRVGDLIIPVLDPTGEDRTAFIQWAIGGGRELAMLIHEHGLPLSYSAAAFASLRSHLKAHKWLIESELKALIDDLIPPAIGKTRRYQELQALINCTRNSLLPTERRGQREKMEEEILRLEAEGIS